MQREVSLLALHAYPLGISPTITLILATPLYVGIARHLA